MSISSDPTPEVKKEEQLDKTEESKGPRALPVDHGTIRFGTMKDLQDKAPELYNKMMQATATDMCNKMRKRQEKLKKIMRGNG